MALAQNPLGSILRHLPSVQHAFAYGSGVLAQPGLYDTQPATATGGAQPSATPTQGGPMLDFILAVDDPVSWHPQNIERNPQHYSWVGTLGPQAIVGIASHVGVGVHFNPMVTIEGRLVKYGVLSIADLLDDLNTWRWLYIAGRMHKPVAPLVQHQGVEAAAARNVRAAALAALLLLPQQFTTEDLLRQVVGLSYHGDVRMGWAEDPHKIARIVAGSLQPLQDTYLPLLQPSQQPSPTAPDGPLGPTTATTAAATSQSTETSSATPSSSDGKQASADGPSTGSSGSRAGPATAVGSGPGSAMTPGRLAGVERLSDNTWRQLGSQDTAVQMIARLPSALLAKVAGRVGFAVPESHCQAGTSTALELAHAVVKTGKHQELVRSALHATVRSASVWQAVSGILGAGGGKAVAYITAKLTKALQSTAPHLKNLRTAAGKTRPS